MERDDARYNWSAKLITSTGRIISFFIINECAGYRDRCATLAMQEDLFFRYLIHAFVPRLIQRMLRQLFDHFNSKKEEKNNNDKIRKDDRGRKIGSSI